MSVGDAAARTVLDELVHSSSPNSKSHAAARALLDLPVTEHEGRAWQHSAADAIVTWAESVERSERVRAGT